MAIVLGLPLLNLGCVRMPSPLSATRMALAAALPAIVYMSIVYLQASVSELLRSQADVSGIW